MLSVSSAGVTAAACVAVAAALVHPVASPSASPSSSPTGPVRPFTAATCPVYFEGRLLTTKAERAHLDQVTAHDGLVGWQALQPRGAATYNLEMLEDHGKVALSVWSTAGVQPSDAEGAFMAKHSGPDPSFWTR
jgi:hypothetical protein